MKFNKAQGAVEAAAHHHDATGRIAMINAWLSDAVIYCRTLTEGRGFAASYALALMRTTIPNAEWWLNRTGSSALVGFASAENARDLPSSTEEMDRLFLVMDEIVLGYSDLMHHAYLRPNDVNMRRHIIGAAAAQRPIPPRYGEPEIEYPPNRVARLLIADASMMLMKAKDELSPVAYDVVVELAFVEVEAALTTMAVESLGNDWHMSHLVKENDKLVGEAPLPTPEDFWAIEPWARRFEHVCLVAKRKARYAMVRFAEDAAAGG